ncbi:MAG TPA: rRNA adenine N-6-methyltransferase family protein, partial [Candidatus Saccharimonadales bacterium]
VPAESFWPSPKVDSTLIHISGIKSQEQLSQSFKNLELKEFWQIAKIGFSARRKQLKNNLQNGLHLPQEQVAEALAAVGLEPSVRAQELEVGEWIELAKRVKKYRSK